MLLIIRQCISGQMSSAAQAELFSKLHIQESRHTFHQEPYCTLAKSISGLFARGIVDRVSDPDPVTSYDNASLLCCCMATCCSNALVNWIQVSSLAWQAQWRICPAVASLTSIQSFGHQMRILFPCCSIRTSHPIQCSLYVPLLW
jgi:hypothetical protein